MSLGPCYLAAQIKLLGLQPTVETYWRSDAFESRCSVSTASPPLPREKQQYFQHAAGFGEGTLAAETWRPASASAKGPMCHPLEAHLGI